MLARKRKIRSLLRRGRRARRARFPTCGVIRVAGYSVVWDLSFPPPLFPLKSTKRSAAAILGRSAPSLLFHGALRIILLSAGFPVTIHMIALEQTFVNGSLQKFFLLLLPFQIESILSVICLSFALDFPALENPISEKTNCCIQPSSHSSHASSSSSNQSGLLAVGAWRTGGLTAASSTSAIINSETRQAAPLRT